MRKQRVRKKAQREDSELSTLSDNYVDFKVDRQDASSARKLAVSRNGEGSGYPLPVALIRQTFFGTGQRFSSTSLPAMVADASSLACHICITM